MRYLIALCLMFVLGFAVQPACAGERFARPLEIGLTGGFSDGPGYASRAPHGSLALEGGTHMLRLHLALSGSLVHKTYTPGGYQVGINGGVDLRFRGFLVTGGLTSSHTDQTIWTKNVRYVYGGLGYRWDVKPNEQGVPRAIHVAGLTYYQEAYSTYPNHTKLYDASYKYYHRLGHDSLYVQIAINLGVMAYRDGPELSAGHHAELSSKFGVGVSWMP